MSEMKMSEHFPEAFQVDHNKNFEVQDVTWYSYGEKYESDCDQDSAFGHAVLNHDRMVEEIAELKGAINQLLKCNGILTSGNSAVVNAKELLSKLSEGK